VDAIRDGVPGFTERNESARLTGAAGYDRPIAGAALLGESAQLTVRSSGTLFDRALEVPGFRFAGTQAASYTEASISGRAGAHDLVLGVDARTDRFDQRDGEARPLDYAYASLGAFGQSTWDVSPALALETGFRLDAHDTYGVFALPRAALLVRIAPNLTGRIGGGLGYTAPTPFVEEAETRAYQRILPIADSLDAERSAGVNLDLNYRTTWGPLAVSVNQAVYATRLTDALIPVDRSGSVGFTNGDGEVLARGSETTLRVSLDDFKLFLGYVYLDATRDEGGRSVELPLVAQHRTYSVLVWEQHGKGRIGLEAYYTGPQRLPDGRRSDGYLIAGLMTQRRVGRVRVFANLENVLDARQSRTDPLVLGPRATPTFAPVWGPTDGFVANAGVIIDL
jgi:iron complex outermembrane receptor protein